MRTFCFLTIVAALVCAAAPRAGADLIVYGAFTDHVLVPGASLADVRLSVDMSVSAGVATVNFTNVSLGTSESAVFKEIVIDTMDDDTGVVVLWAPTIISSSVPVSYYLRPSNGLPGYQTLLGARDGVAEFQACPPPPAMGIGVGETVVVEFYTALLDGSTIDDYLAFFNGGDDTGDYSIGFHAISADVVDGESLSGMNVPEPGALALLAVGAAGLIRRRRR